MKDKIYFIKTHPLAKVPTKAYEDDAGWDLYSVEDKLVKANTPTVINTGICVALPRGYYWEIHTRGSQGIKGIRNHLGIGDNGYRNDVSPIIVALTDIQILTGDKVAQLIIRKMEDSKMEWKEVKELPPSKRGIKRFGSSGR